CALPISVSTAFQSIMGKEERKRPMSSMPTKPEILKRTLECESRLFRVESLDLRFSNGQERTFERLIGSGVPAVIVVPMLDDQRVILVREYGAGIHDYHVSLPKGRVD